VPRARRRATAGIGQEWASSGFGGALPVLCEEILRTTSHYQESGRCGTGRFLHIEHFEERSSFSTWLTRIAINSALMISRRRRNFSEILAKDSGAVGWSQEIADSAPNAEKHYLAQKRERLVQRAIRSLRPNIRGVLEMQHSQDYSVEEIARVMSISVGAVKGRLFHARKALRRAPSLRNIGGSKFRARRTTTRSRTGDG
jgi:RNA polymerase sigma factor (sigma-70 family)